MGKQKSDEPQFISVPAAAELLGCSDVWVVKMILSGELQGFKLSKRAWAVDRKSALKNRQEYLNRDPTLSGRKRSKIN